MIGKESMETDAKTKVNAAEYEKLPQGPPQQLIRGEIVMTPAPNFLHQRLVFKIAIFLESYVKERSIGIVNISPIDVYLNDNEVYQPDIIFISNEHKNIIGDNIKGIPDLIVEVLSPSNAYYDLTHKKNIYEETGVKEFWLVDPDEKTVEIYENTNGTFMLFSKAKKSGTVSSKLLNGLNIEIEKLFVEI